MQRFAMIASLIVLVACAAPAPTVTPKPASVPTPMPTSAPTKPPVATATVGKPPIGPASKATIALTPQAIRFQDVKKDKRADGSWVTSANVTAPENLGLGQIELASPDTMRVDETRAIRLRLSPAQQLAALTPVAAPGKTPDIPSFVYRYSGNVELYPLMYAELRALAFDVDQKGPVRRVVEANKPVEWVWVIRPLMVGRHEITLELAVPVIINGVTTEMSTRVLQDLTAAIQVTALPELPTPTPRSTTDRISDSIIEHSGAIIAAVIGIFGTILGGLVALLRRKR